MVLLSRILPGAHIGLSNYQYDFQAYQRYVCHIDLAGLGLLDFILASKKALATGLWRTSATVTMFC